MVAFSSLYGERLSRELGNDDSTQLFTTARRKAAINQGQQQFCELTECLVRRSTVTVTGGTAEYDLNSTTVLPSGDFVRLDKQGIEFHYTDASSNVQIVAGDDLPRRDVAWLNRYEPGWQTSTVSTATGPQTPAAYYLRPDGPAFYLGFWPTPSTGSSASAQVVVNYVAEPTTLSADADQPFTVNSSARTDLAPYHQAIVHYAAHELEKFRRDDEASDRQLQKFMGYVARFMGQQRPKAGTSLTLGRSYFQPSGGLTDRPRDPRT